MVIVDPVVIVIDSNIEVELSIDRCGCVWRCSSNQILFTSSFLLRSSIESSNRGASNTGSSLPNEDTEEVIGRRSNEYPSSPARSDAMEV